MSKKEQLPSMDMALAGQEVNSGIDMRLSKSDLIEMVVEERKEQLEKQIDSLSSVVSEKHKALYKLDRHGNDTLKKALTKEIESEFKALIKATMAVLPGCKPQFSESCSDAWGLRNIKVDSHPSRNSLTKIELVDKTDSSQDRYYGDDKCYYRLQLQIVAKRENEDLAKPHVGLTIQKKASAAQLAAYRKETKAQYEDYVASHNQLVDLKNELAELGRRGGRYKAELTKRLLSGSKAGQELLSAMEGVRALMITNSNKK